MKRSVLLSLVLVLLSLSLACSAIGGGGSDNGDVGPRPATDGGMQITIVNRSPDDICYVLISESDDDMWGEDRLGSDETIEPGDSRAFSVDAATYDVRVENCDEAAMATAWEVSQSTTVTAGASGADRRLLVENNSDVEVCFIFISPTTADDWGEDKMGDMESLPPGAQRIFYVQGGTYDLQAADCEAETLTEEYEVDLSEDLTWSLEN